MAAGSALTLAVELHRDPSRIDEVRMQALPRDIGRVLGLLSGHVGRLQAAAAQEGSDVQELLVAARHYVREVMLHAEADDARMLGLTPGATSETLKLHYRALQSWLHPDRDSAPPDAGELSARINAAWSRLRAAEAGEQAAVQAGLRPHWRRVDLREARRFPRWPVAVAAIAGLLVAGGWLLATAFDPRPEPATPRNSPAPRAAAGRAAPPDPAVEAAAASVPATVPVVERPVPSTEALPEAVIAAVPDGSRNAPESEGPADGQDVEVALPEPASAPALAATRPPAPPGPAPRPLAVTDTGMVGATARPVQPPAAAAVATVGAGRQSAVAAVASPAMLREDAPERPQPAPVEAAAAVLPVVDAAAESTMHPPTDVAQPAVTPAVTDKRRAANARAQAAALLGFLLQREGSAPPIWHSGHAYDQAENVRTALAAGRKSGQPYALREVERWRFESDRAVLRVPVEPAEPERGVQIVQAELQWKDEAWWVDRVSVEPAQ